MNVVTLVGRLGRDPDMRMTANGTSVCNISIATNRPTKGKETDWHRIVIWGKAADVASQYLRKGSECAVTGHLQYRDWEDREGNKKQTAEIHCNQLSLIGGKSSGGNQDRSDGQPRAAPPGFNESDDVPF